MATTLHKLRPAQGIETCLPWSQSEDNTGLLRSDWEMCTGANLSIREHAACRLLQRHGTCMHMKHLRCTW